MLICLVVGALTGLVSMFLANISGWADPVLGKDPHAPMFFIGCIVGFSLSYVLMGVVLSAVDSIIVCFAEAPGMCCVCIISLYYRYHARYINSRLFSTCSRRIRNTPTGVVARNGGSVATGVSPRVRVLMRGHGNCQPSGLLFVIVK